jgi:hypothetical protein
MSRRQLLGQKKSSEPCGSEDCTLVCLVLRRSGRLAHVPGRLEALDRALPWNRRQRRKRFFPHPAGLLALGSSYSPGLPVSLVKNSGFSGFRPRSQRRDRSRITRDSLLNVAYLMGSCRFPFIFLRRACQLQSSSSPPVRRIGSVAGGGRAIGMSPGFEYNFPGGLGRFNLLRGVLPDRL